MLRAPQWYARPAAGTSSATTLYGVCAEVYCSARTRVSHRPYRRACPVNTAFTSPPPDVPLIVSIPCWLRTRLGRLTAQSFDNRVMKPSCHCESPHRKILPAFVGYVAVACRWVTAGAVAAGCGVVAAETARVTARAATPDMTTPRNSARGSDMPHTVCRDAANWQPGCRQAGITGSGTPSGS